jgi:hypothetical protein
VAEGWHPGDGSTIPNGFIQRRVLASIRPLLIEQTFRFVSSQVCPVATSAKLLVKLCGVATYP